MTIVFGQVLRSSYGDPAFNACSVIRIVSVFNVGVYSYFNIYVFYNMAGANIKKLNNGNFAPCLFQIWIVPDCYLGDVLRRNNIHEHEK